MIKHEGPSVKVGAMFRVRRLLAALVILLLLLGTALPLSGADRGQIRVIIDPGHGGEDSGAVAFNLVEKEFNLAIAHLIYLKALGDPQLEIILTRRKDVTLALNERIAMAHRLGADLYIAIHANASPNPRTQGLETLIAERAADGDGSLKLAQVLQKRLIGELEVLDRGVREQALFISKLKMPAALVEVGFLTNKEEANRLKKLYWQARIADALLKAIKDFINISR